MGNPEHLAKIKEGVTAWNAWREANETIQPNLTRADLSGMDLTEVDFRGVGLFKAKLHGAILVRANLRQARLVKTEFDRANLSGASVYGTSVWDVSLKEAIQKDLVITEPGTSLITVDNLEVAQFIYLLLNNQNLRNVIDTITSKMVLILGCFSPPRKIVLDAIRDELRKRNYLPVLFDFTVPVSRDVTETVRILAGLARFVVADVTDATEVRVELQHIVRDFPSLPIQPLLLKGEPTFVSLPGHLTSFPWLLSTYEYATPDDLIANLGEVIGPAERTVLELRRKKSQFAG